MTDRDEYMRRQEAEHDMIRMRDPSRSIFNRTARLDPLSEELRTLRAENERLRSALKPFEVNWLKAGLFQDEGADPIAVELRIVGTGWTDKVTVADLKAVRAALSEAQP